MSEQELIRRLSASAAEPDDVFATRLRAQLQDRAEALNINTPRRVTMNYTKLSIGLASFIAVMAIAGIVVMQRDATEQPTAQTTTSASMLPNQQASSLEAAKQSLSFEPRTPSKQLQGETLSDIRTGQAGNMIDDSDTLYLTYKDGQGTLYKISQSTKKFNYPTDVKSVTLSDGSKASYHAIPEFEDSGAINSNGSDVSSPRSYLFWSKGGVNYEISEFGRVSQSQLVEIANSLK